MTESEFRLELEALALSLDAEVALCTTRAHHIRATANANALRFILHRLPVVTPGS